jgi:hypothetical protein
VSAAEDHIRAIHARYSDLKAQGVAAFISFAVLILQNDPGAIGHQWWWGGECGYTDGRLQPGPANILVPSWDALGERLYLSRQRHAHHPGDPAQPLGDPFYDDATGELFMRLVLGPNHVLAFAQVYPPPDLAQQSARHQCEIEDELRDGVVCLLGPRTDSAPGRAVYLLTLGVQVS